MNSKYQGVSNYLTHAWFNLLYLNVRFCFIAFKKNILINSVFIDHALNKFNYVLEHLLSENLSTGRAQYIQWLFMLQWKQREMEIVLARRVNNKWTINVLKLTTLEFSTSRNAVIKDKVYIGSLSLYPAY